MHHKLSEILEEEVIGEVAPKDGALCDVGLGRICLEPLSRVRIDDLLTKLRQAMGKNVEVRDQLYPADPNPLYRGVVEAHLEDPALGAPYILQITGKPIAAYYERRFMLESDVQGDLMGLFIKGLVAAVTQGAEEPLRILSGYEQLVALHRKHLDEAVQAALNGTSYDASRGVNELIEPLRRVWKLIPWPLREKLHPLARDTIKSRCAHEPTMHNTLLFATRTLDGKIVYSHVHQPNPIEQYIQVAGWLGEIFSSMGETYTPPTYVSTLARASSVHKFLEYFPGYQKIVGLPISATAERAPR